MSKKRNILMIVEGQKADRKIMEFILKEYINEDFNLFVYDTNIYELYQRIINEYGDLEDLDFIQLLKSKEKDITKKSMFDKKYTDIILVFDLDPQDPLYSNEKIIKLLGYFNESTDNGKLYINYPMIEAFKHIKGYNDTEFLDREVTLKELCDRSYKKRANEEAFQNDVRKYTKDDIKMIVEQNLKKVNFILNNNKSEILKKEDYFKLSLEELLKKQVYMLENDKKIYVLSTCGFYIIDYNPSLLFMPKK